MTLHMFVRMCNLSKSCVVMEPESSKENQDPNPFKERLSLSLSARRKANERFYCVTTKQLTAISKPMWLPETPKTSKWALSNSKEWVNSYNKRNKNDSCPP